MKKTIFLTLTAILLTVSLKAQMNLFLLEQEVGLPDGISTAWVFPVPGEADEALDDLKDFCKDRSDVKMKNGGDMLLIAEKASLSAIAAKRGDLVGFTYLAEQKQVMALVFQLGYDISLNSADWTGEMESFRNYTKSFMSYHYEQVYARRLKGMEKELKSLQKEKGQDLSKINGLNDKVANLGKKIAKETETEEINALEAQIRTLEADVQLLMDALPPLEEKISQLTKMLEEQKTESYTYLSTIGRF